MGLGANMAEQVVYVLNDVLCFLRNKYGRVAVKQLKSAIMDFYTVEDLAEAKLRLLSDIRTLEKTVKFPHVPQRRDGENRAAREVEDIVNLFNCLDEHKVLDSLPTYVSANPDRMPSLRLFEGDMNVLLTMIEKMARTIEEYGSSLCAITRDVSALQAKFVTLDQWPPLQSVVDINRPTSAQLWPPRQPQSQQPQSQQPGVRAGNSVNTETNAQRSADGDCRDWAVLASTPNIRSSHPNRVAPPTSVADDEGPFEVVQSKKTKRHRVESQQQQQQQQQRQRASNGGVNSRDQQRRSRSTLYGKSTVATNLTAARKLQKKKAVFCIDNISTECTPEDIKSFVSAMSVNVVSCYEVKPRRRPSEDESDVMDRKAFRLCIDAEDCDRLLNADIWPDSVVIAEWFSKPRQHGQDNEQAKRRRLGATEESLGEVINSVNEAAAAAAVAQPAPANNVQVNVSIANDSTAVSDETIIGVYHMDHSPNSADNDV